MPEPTANNILKYIFTGSKLKLSQKYNYFKL